MIRALRFLFKNSTGHRLYRMERVLAHQIEEFRNMSKAAEDFNASVALLGPAVEALTAAVNAAAAKIGAGGDPADTAALVAALPVVQNLASTVEGLATTLQNAINPPPPVEPAPVA